MATEKKKKKELEWKKEVKNDHTRIVMLANAKCLLRKFESWVIVGNEDLWRCESLWKSYTVRAIKNTSFYKSKRKKFDNSCFILR